MKNFKSLLIIILSATLLVACGQKTPHYAVDAPTAEATPAPMDMSRAKIAGGAEQALTETSEPRQFNNQPENTNSKTKRYIALTHSLTVETPAKDMQAAFDATLQHCEQLKCQILNANFNRETQFNAPSASLSVRVPPRSIKIFLTELARNSEVLSHSRASEDKTDAVIDADARIKNLTDLRDKLRAMLTDKSAKFKDVIDVERELASTQTQLDSMAGVRKALAQETELVAINIQFTATQNIAQRSFFGPVAEALHDSGRVMMESFASVIKFFVSAIPWLLFGIPALILVRKFWLKLKIKFLQK